MKICVISSIFFPYARGGAETAAEAAARAFVEHGHEVFVITVAPFEGRECFAGKWGTMKRSTTNTEHEEPRNEIRVFRFTPLNLFTIFSIAKRPALLRMIWHLIDMVNPHTYLVVRRILLAEKPDLILTHNLKGLGYSVHLAVHHSRYIKQFVKQKARWFHTLHDLGALHPTGLKLWGREKSLFQNNPLVALYAWINKKLLGDPDVIISPSQFLLDEYRKRGFFPKSRIAVVRNPVIFQKTENRIQKTDFCPPSSVLRPPRFLYIGQLEPYKGLHLLLEAWKEFSGAHKDAELIIAGTGSMKEEVERTAKSLTRMQYVGFVAQDKLDALFSKVHAMILPSLAYENSPTSIGEAFAYGLPVIASRIGGIPELVQDGINGVLFEPGNFKALVLAMEKVTKEWKILCVGAQKSAENFYPARYLEQTEALIKKL
ncbi:glycosyltransferase [Candidatus Uhrbacteria bacterium]|nr:glycosyltransferase [Candidatus Uhrbacteria bacterium]